MESEEFSAAEEGGKGDRKRRFSEEQIRSLESMFETQNKLEPRKKAQLARELGLQPRQVAIWFQNKRARWKSKQLEREYSTLRSDYEALLSNFESLKKEKLLLVKQLQKLAEMLEKPADQSSNDGDSDNGDGKREEATKPSKLLREEEEKQLNCFNYEGDHNLLYSTAPAAGSLASAEQQQCCLSCSCFPEQCCCATNPQWWEFWPTT